VPSERQILDPLRRSTVAPKSGLVLGIGDDCAVYRPRAGEDLVFTTDFSIQDVHFRLETHTAAQIGHNALARGLSDIAAMGATPQFCLLSLAVPALIGTRWVRAFYAGLVKLADSSGTVLAGGDLARSGKLHCDIVVAGALPRGSALQRSGAKPGDTIYVSGTLGGSALGLETGRGPAWKRHLRIEPRIRLGQYLRSKLKATACMDLSDGLSLDLRRLCLESKVSAALTSVPVFPGASADQALHGGEDYELLFTVNSRTHVPEYFDKIPLTRIGEVTPGSPGRVLWKGKRLKSEGYDHFRTKP
jgi:thiamine-monophosphate kinase